LEINKPDALAELTAAFARYEAAFVANDVATLTELFWDSPLTVRYGGGENLYGAAEIAAFRQGRGTGDLDRDLGRTVLTTFGDGFGTASTLFRRRQNGPADAELGEAGRSLAHRRGPCFDTGLSLPRDGRDERMRQVLR
jgi:hypothetical protein